MLKATIILAVCLGAALASYRGNYNDPYAPSFPAFTPSPFIDPFEFHSQLTAYIQGQQFQQNSGGVGGGAGGTYTYASPGGSAYAATSLHPDNENYYNEQTGQYEPYEDQRQAIFQENFARQQAFFDALQRQAQFNSLGGGGAYASGGAYAGTHGTGTYGSHGSSGHGNGLYGSKYGGGSYAPNYAFASGSYNGGKHHGSASIYPSNSKVPNINNRFGGDSNPGGFHSVSTSSFSESSNVNGQEHNRRGAQTTFNDNGKITTYKTHS
ncbi:hypothetical protein ACFFRR_004186 [Megaselia abdita]